MATGMAIAGGGLVGGRMSIAAQTVTISTQDTAVAVGGTSAAVGDSQGFTVGVTGLFTATFAGTRLCHIRASLAVESADNTLTNAALAIMLNAAEVAGTDSVEQDTDTDVDPKLFEIDDYMLVSNGDTVGLGLINGDDTANLVTIAAVDRTGTNADHGPSTGWFTIDG